MPSPLGTYGGYPMGTPSPAPRRDPPYCQAALGLPSMFSDRMHRLATICAVLVASTTLTACGGSPAAQPDELPAAIRGTVALRQGDYEIQFSGESSRCSGAGRLGDVTEGAEIRVENEAGDAVSVGALGSGSRDVASFNCVFRFELDGPGEESPSYTVFVGTHEARTLSHQDMSDLGWVVDVALGG